jgi:hypothetical protein
VLGLGATTSAPMAAFANGAMAYALDFEDRRLVTRTPRRAVAAYDPVATSSRASCEPRPAPRIMIAADTKSIELNGDAVRIRAEYDLTDRIAYLDARPPQGRTLHGHSLARWQGGALIVETSNFTENAIGVTNGFPSSTEKHLLERFALDADGQSLLYSFELTDPVYLAAPLRGELRWLYRPNLDVELVPCDPEATRSFLDN